MIENYIGIPYDLNNVEGLNCLSFFTRVQRELFGVELGTIKHDNVNIYKNKVFRRWKKIETPQHGCGVIMGRHAVPIHIGVYVENKEEKGILHCYEKIGSIFSPLDLSDIELKVIGYYEYNS